MPALDALQGKLGSDKFEVVAVNIDTRNLDKPKAWLQEVGIEQLGYYAIRARRCSRTSSHRQGDSACRRRC
jgi:hypothetical protein